MSREIFGRMKFTQRPIDGAEFGPTTLAQLKASAARAQALVDGLNQRVAEQVAAGKLRVMTFRELREELRAAKGKEKRESDDDQV